MVAPYVVDGEGVERLLEWRGEGWGAVGRPDDVVWFSSAGIPFSAFSWQCFVLSCSAALLGSLLLLGVSGQRQPHLGHVSVNACEFATYITMSAICCGPLTWGCQGRVLSRIPGIRFSYVFRE